MPIIHALAAPNGAPCTYFAALRVDVDLDPKAQDATAKVQVGGWITEAARLEGQLAVFNWFPLVPRSALNMQDLAATAETALVQFEGSPWLGGSLVSAPSDLAGAKARRWAMIKQQRNDHEFGLLSWDGCAFDADQRSQARIQGAVQLASLAAAAGEQFTMPWTLADNSVRTLDSADVVALGQALAQQVSGAHEIARGLRLQIDAAETLEQVEAVAWPA